MRTLILCLCLVAAPALGQTVDRDKAVVGRNAHNSTARFVDLCKRDVSWCNGYIQGAAAAQTQPPLCSPPGIDGNSLHSRFLAWYAKNPAAADLMAPFSVIRFNTESFPCGATRS